MPNADRIEGNSILRREWRQLGRFALESLGTGLFVSLVLALAVFIISFEAKAAGTGGPSQGTLLLREASDGKTEAPLLDTSVHMDVSGMVARIQVRQRFVNPTAEWREGVYVFPLPDKAAVDHLTMHIGERVIEGQIKERSEARRTYENAKSEGRRTTLVEQERPNMFTTNVANIGPGEEIVVALEYEETLRYDNGSFHLRFPMAITPRYIPAEGNSPTSDGASGSLATQPVVDSERITPPYVSSRGRTVNPMSIAIDLNAGFALTKLASSYHAINVEERPGNRYHIDLASEQVPATRDFELVWTPDVGAAPAAALFTETKGGTTYALLMALPPTAQAVPMTRPPREITYIIDTSGSMEGVSIAQARDALVMALDRLQPGDSFNIIEFNSTSTPLFSSPMPLDESTLAQAKRFARGLRARGGTEMLPALQIALAGDARSVLMRQVVFLTDGAVGNEDEILRFLHDKMGDRRLFTIGIGPSPNTFFLTKAAQFGRGTFTFIGDVREVAEKMTALFRKLENPALTDIVINWPGGADAWPKLVPDLYAGEPVVVTAQFPAGTLQGNVGISGKRAGADWQTSLPVFGGAPEAGVAVLWARAKIDALMDAGRQGAPEPEIRNAVLDIALTHHLVSKYTSLVAVDVTPARPSGVDTVKTALPGNVPEGLTGFDQLPQTATPAALSIVIGLFMLLVAALMALFIGHRHTNLLRRI